MSAPDVKLSDMDTSVDKELAAEPDSFETELDAFVDTASCSDSWRVEKLLKRSGYETTEVVVRTSEEPVPAAPERAVRKRIDGAPGAGGAYEMLYRAQQQGTRLDGVPRILECFRTGKTLHVVMEYVEGPSLEEYIAGVGPGVAVLRDLAPGLCRTVYELHTRLEAPLIHRDLKPSNIIIFRRRPWVIDFGISRVWHQDAESDTSCFATRCYAPPEQFGFGQTDERSDVYALGKTLFFCMTGEHPPNVCTAKACEAAGMDEALAAVIGKACSFSPGDRWESVGDLGRAVGSALASAEASPDRETRQTADEASSVQSPRLHGPRGAWPSLPHVQGDDAGLRAIAAVFRELPAIAQTLCVHLVRAVAWLREGPASEVVGKAWNTCVLIVVSYVLSASAYLVAFPNERDAALPPWFRIFEYIVMLGGIFAVFAFVLLDRRRIGRRFPALARHSFAFELVGALIISILLVLFVSLCGMAAGLV